jgi:ElaB/YqjD/DUF883 family membrane-anchored ribosome-binding protein
MTQERISELRDELARLGAELEDVALDVLRRAVDEGAQSRPAEERALSQARRAVERAVRALDPHAD